MAILSAKQYEKLQREVQDWYIKTRDRLIDDFEADGYPYGSVPLSEREQLARYLQMQDADWRLLFERVMSRHIGKPNQMKLALTEMKRYQVRMERLREKYGGGAQVQQTVAEGDGSLEDPYAEIQGTAAAAPADLPEAY